MCHSFPCLLQSQANLPETLDGNRGENALAAAKVSVQDGLAVGDFIGKPSDGYAGPAFKLRDAPCGADDLRPAGLPVTQLSFRYSARCRLRLHR